MDYRGIVFFDYDGTLADEKEGIYLPTKTTIEAIKRLRENKYLTVLATGRALCYVPDMGIDFGGYVTSNGAYAEIEKKEVFQHFIGQNDLQYLITTLEEMGLYYSLENQKRCYAKDKNATIFKNMIDNFKIPQQVFDKLDINNLPKTSKLLVAYNNLNEHETLKKACEGKYEITMHRKYPSADIQPVKINKAVGAAKIAECLHINKENIYAFGDGTNDYQLFEIVGHPIAMGYHADMLDNICEFITDTVANEGIYKGLVRFGLI